MSAASVTPAITKPRALTFNIPTPWRKAASYRDWETCAGVAITSQLNQPVPLMNTGPAFC